MVLGIGYKTTVRVSFFQADGLRLVVVTAFKVKKQKEDIPDSMVDAVNSTRLRLERLHVCVLVVQLSKSNGHAGYDAHCSF